MEQRAAIAPGRQPRKSAPPRSSRAAPFCLRARQMPRRTASGSVEATEALRAAATRALGGEREAVRNVTLTPESWNGTGADDDL